MSSTHATHRTLDLSIQSIRHQFGEHVVLQDISLDINAGDVVCLAGPSGCGKSTLLRLIAGLERVQSGQLLIKDQCVASASWHQEPETRGIGMVFQDFALFPHITILDNVSFGLSHLSRAARKARAMAMLERVGLAARANDYPHVLSGGQQQRIALARALAPEPQILLLDEPFSNLDVRLRHRIRLETLELLKATGTTSILVTHDPDEAMFMADHIALMFNGRILQTGTPENLYRHPGNAFAAEFFGDINSSDGTVLNEHVETPFGQLAAPGFAHEAAVQIMLRPEAIKPARLAPQLSLTCNGKILATHMLGATIAITVELECGRHLQMQVANDTGIREGETLLLALDPKGAFIFPR